ncbi:hypothetical protein J2S74_003869 [Evansella vedderi]|uniref:Uncharacterized protein n=1 Tax=Evansella vedderi TaxID=38282 RepID=A0ABU0A003_9BACI|nr:hypothetical protein [Evansella vedderi]
MKREPHLESCLGQLFMEKKLLKRRDHFFIREENDDGNINRETLV